MSLKQQAGAGQSLCHSQHKKVTTAPESNSDDSGMISKLPTPTWSGGSDHLNEDTPKHTEDQVMEDVPSTQEVAVTLAGMRSRGDNRGHKVHFAQFSHCE